MDVAAWIMCSSGRMGEQPLADLVSTVLGDLPNAEMITRWITAVRTWNQRMDMTAARDDRELVDLMLADAVVLGREIAADQRVVDVGSGAGAPRPFEVAVSRATLAPPAWLALGAELAPTVWLLLAREEAPQLDGWQPTRDVSYTWPLTGASRRLVCCAYTG